MTETLGTDDIQTGAGILSGSDRSRDERGFSLAGVRADVARFVERPSFTIALSAVIVINAITLGLETSPSMVAAAGALLVAIDHAALAIFTLEIAFKLFAYGPRFFRSGWNVFDFLIVGIALVPASGAFAVLRTLRVLRVLRLISVVPQLRAVIGALLGALPGMGAIIGVLLLIFYIASVMATKIFAEAFPDWFGTIGLSMFTLFQIMTLDSWAMDVVRPVMETYPWAWAFFIPFIILTSFAVLNLFIAIIVNSMNTAQRLVQAERIDGNEELAHDERSAIMAELLIMRDEMAELRASVGKHQGG